MNLRLHIGRLFAVFVIVGLVAAPLVAPETAKRRPAGEMSDMAAMTGDMPCCPAGPKTNSCQDCPLVAMCMLTTAQAEPSPTSSLQLFFQARLLAFALVDFVADGLIGAPPDHPPRILT